MLISVTVCTVNMDAGMGGLCCNLGTTQLAVGSGAFLGQMSTTIIPSQAPRWSFVLEIELIAIVALLVIVLLTLFLNGLCLYYLRVVAHNRRREQISLVTIGLNVA